MGKGMQDNLLKILICWKRYIMTTGTELLHDIEYCFFFFFLQGTCDGVKGYFHKDYVTVKEWS